MIALESNISRNIMGTPSELAGSRLAVKLLQPNEMHVQAT
jgi:hypothetical protein